MGKIEDWEEIIGSIIESLFFGAEMSFDEEALRSKADVGRNLYEAEGRARAGSKAKGGEKERGGEEARVRISQNGGAVSVKNAYWSDYEAAERGKRSNFEEEALRERICRTLETEAYLTEQIRGLLGEEGMSAAFWDSECMQKSAWPRTDEVLQSLMYEDMSLEKAGYIDTVAELERKEICRKESEGADKYFTQGVAAVGVKSFFGDEYGAWEEEAEAYLNDILSTKRTDKSTVKKIIESGAEAEIGGGREVKIEMVNNNNISSKVDIDEVCDMMTMKIYDIMRRSADGAY